MILTFPPEVTEYYECRTLNLNFLRKCQDFGVRGAYALQVEHVSVDGQDGFYTLHGTVKPPSLGDTPITY
jgi:hypothetical protein